MTSTTKIVLIGGAAYLFFTDSGRSIVSAFSPSLGAVAAGRPVPPAGYAYNANGQLVPAASQTISPASVANSIVNAVSSALKALGTGSTQAAAQPKSTGSSSPGFGAGGGSAGGGSGPNINGNKAKSVPADYFTNPNSPGYEAPIPVTLDNQGFDIWGIWTPETSPVPIPPDDASVNASLDAANAAVAASQSEVTLIDPLAGFDFGGGSFDPTIDNAVDVSSPDAGGATQVVDDGSAANPDGVDPFLFSGGDGDVVLEDPFAGYDFADSSAGEDL